SVSVANIGMLNFAGLLTTTGAGNISFTANNPGSGDALFLLNPSSLTAAGTGSITLTGTTVGAGIGVSANGNLSAPGGNITINGTGGSSSGSANVIGVVANA